MECLGLDQLSCVNGLQNHSSSDIHTLELWEDRILTPWWVMLFNYSHLKSATQKEANRYRCQTSISLMRWLLETTDWSTSLFCVTRAMHLTKVKDDLIFCSSKRCTSNTNIFIYSMWICLAQTEAAHCKQLTKFDASDRNLGCGGLTPAQRKVHFRFSCLIH